MVTPIAKPALIAHVLDTTVQAPGVTTPVNVNFDTNVLLSKITHSVSVNPHNITLTRTGLYVVTFTGLVAKTAGAVARDLDAWFRLGGVDIANTRRRQTLINNNEFHVLKLSLARLFNAGSVLSVAFAVSNAAEGLGFRSIAAAGDRPLAPSVELTVFKTTKADV